MLTYRELRILRAADAAERERGDRVARIRALAFDKQLAVMDDPSPLISILCTRRSGKSMTVGLDTCASMEANPGASHLIVGLTRESIKRIYWKDVLHHINDAARLGYEFNRSELSMRAPNGAVCYFVGVDTSEDEKRKILGQKFAKAWADEAGEYKIDLSDLVYQTLKPAVSDYRGQIGLAGTPGEFLGSVEEPQLFYAVTRDGYDPENDKDNGGWSTHRWSAFDNPHQAAIHAEQLDEIEKQRPEFKNTTKYLTHYLGKWPSVSDKLVYKFDSARNSIDAAPTCTSFVVACDLGFNDATSFVVLGWRQHDPNLYILSATKKTELDFDQVGTEIRRLRAVYPSARLVIDGANKQGVEHMRRVYSLPLEAAEKHAKYDYVRMMNTDLQMKRVRVVKAECAALTSEWLSLEWDKRSRVPKEDEGVDNHCADAALYGWRLARHYLAEPEKPPKPTQDSEAAFEAEIMRRPGAQRSFGRKRGLL